MDVFITHARAHARTYTYWYAGIYFCCRMDISWIV